MASAIDSCLQHPPTVSFNETSFASHATDNEAPSLVSQASVHANRQEYKEAMQIYLKLTDDGNLEAPHQASVMLKEGGELAKQQAFQVCYEASGTGSRTASQYLGFMYEHGYGVSKDAREAINHYGKAHENGVAFAAYNMAVIYERGGEGVPKDYESARINYLKADGSEVPNASYRIGRIYERGGFGIKKNDETALSWYNKADQQGVPVASKQILAMCLDGRADAKFARGYLEGAAAQGDHRAKVVLEGIVRDELAAKELELIA